MFLETIINQLDIKLPDLKEKVLKPSLLAMVGLPGSGKSSIVRGLQNNLPCIVISTDGIRKQLLGQPTYTQNEIGQIYDICRGLIERKLNRNQRVVFDASNYSMARRNRLRELANRTDAVLTFCRVHADEAIVSKRLDERMNGQRDAGDMSDADLSVYRWMAAAEEPIQGAHLQLDTSALMVKDAVKQLIAYWQQVESRATGKNHF